MKMNVQSLIVISLIVICGIASAQTATSLVYLVQEGNQAGFARLRGKQTRLDLWNSVAKLDGFDRCEIDWESNHHVGTDDKPGVEMNCTKTGVTAVEAEGVRLREKVRSELPNTWRELSRYHDNYYVFESPQGQQVAILTRPGVALISITSPLSAAEASSRAQEMNISAGTQMPELTLDEFFGKLDSYQKRRFVSGVADWGSRFYSSNVSSQIRAFFFNGPGFDSVANFITQRRTDYTFAQLTVGEAVTDYIVQRFGSPQRKFPAPERTIKQYAALKEAQDTFVQSVATDYASFYGSDTRAQIMKFFTEKSDPKSHHAAGVYLVNGLLREKLEKDPNAPQISVNDIIADIIVTKWGMPPKR